MINLIQGFNQALREFKDWSFAEDSRRGFDNVDEFIIHYNLREDELEDIDESWI